MNEYSEECLETFLKNQGQLFDEPVAATLSEAEAFLSDCMFRNRKKDAVILKQNIDSPFITQLEQRNQNLRFARIDSELDEAFKGKKAVAKEDQDSLTEIFRKNLEKDKLKIEVENMRKMRRTVPSWKPRSVLSGWRLRRRLPTRSS